MSNRQAHLPLSSRRVAADVLNQVDPARQLVHPVLERNLDRTEQRQRCMDLVLGVVRNRMMIDAVIERLSQRPVDRISRPLTGVLRVAVFELIYCPLTPAHAIVHEAVEVARDLAGPRQVGFVNAVLRRITDHVADREALLPKVGLARVVPTDPGHGCMFDQPVLPDAEAQTSAYLSLAFSLPPWLAQDWMDRWGREVAWQVAMASNRRPGIYLRANPLKTTADDLVTRLLQQGLDAVLCQDRMIRVSGCGPIEQVPGFSEGWFAVQDPTAASVVTALQPQPQWRILDLCAAPGGKTIQMAEVTQDRAFILATDAEADRLERLRETVGRLGLRSVRTIALETLDQPDVRCEGFDLVLVDVPCSNTGVMARRPEVRYRVRPAAVSELCCTQAGLLEKAAALVRPAGRLGYSTCSIQKAENEDMVQNFTCGHPEFDVISERLTLPSADPIDHDGGYVAVIERKEQEVRSKKSFRF